MVEKIEGVCIVERSNYIGEYKNFQEVADRLVNVEVK